MTINKKLCTDKLYQNLGNPSLLSLLPKHPRVCLDCGCGAGDNARILKSQGWRVTGITASPLERQTASEFCEHIYLADLENGIPPDIEGSFDVVLMSHVLEHLLNPEKLLYDARRILDRKGLIAIAIPNALHYPNRLRFLLGNFDYTDSGVMDQSHVRFYTLKTIVELIQLNSYEIVAVQSDGSIPLWKLRNAIPVCVVEKLTRWALQWRPGFFGWQFLIVAKPYL